MGATLTASTASTENCRLKRIGISLSILQNFLQQDWDSRSPKNNGWYSRCVEGLPANATLIPHRCFIDHPNSALWMVFASPAWPELEPGAEIPEFLPTYKALSVDEENV